jgi:hypothetical protein
MSPSPPANNQIPGTLGHTNDHNTLVTIITSLQSAVAALQAAPPAMALNGGNVSAVPGTATSFAQVTVSAGNRDGGADVLDFFYGSQKIFSLNPYGEPRITAAALTHVAQIIYVLAGQSADAWQILSSSLAVLARVGPDGSAGFAGPVSRLVGGAPAAWVHCTMANGWTAYASRTLAVKLTNDNMVQVSGQLVPGTTADGTTVATLPAGFAPARPETVMVGQTHLQTAAAYTGPYLEAETAGNLNIFSLGSVVNTGGGHLVVGGRYPLNAS